MAKATIQKMLDEIHSKMKTDITAGLQHMCDDAKILPPHHGAVSGKTEMEKFYKSKKEKDPKSEYDMKFTVGDVVELGDVAVVDGGTVLSKDGKEIDQGKFLAVLKKVNGEYKMLRTMANTSKPRDGCL